MFAKKQLLVNKKMLFALRMFFFSQNSQYTWPINIRYMYSLKELFIQRYTVLAHIYNSTLK